MIVYTLGLGFPCGVWRHSSCSFFWCLCSRSWQLSSVHKTQLLHLFVCKTNAAPRLCLIMEDNLMRSIKEHIQHYCGIIVEWLGFVNLNIWSYWWCIVLVDLPHHLPWYRARPDVPSSNKKIKSIIISASTKKEKVVKSKLSSTTEYMVSWGKRKGTSLTLGIHWKRWAAWK